MNREVIVSWKDVLICSKFAEDSHLHHSAHERSRRQTKEHIFIGKLGEFAFKKYYGDEVSDVNLVIDINGDGGKDFIFHAYPEYKIDVKTVRTPYYDKVFFSLKNPNFSHLASMYIKERLKNNNFVMGFRGFLNKKDAIQLSVGCTDPQEREFYYVHHKYFKINI